MAEGLVTLYAQQFSSTVNLLSQQKGSKLRNTVMTGSYVGKAASPVDQFGAIEMQLVSGRYNPMSRVDAPSDRRWVFPSDWDLTQNIDSFDKLRLLIDPSAAYVQNAVYSAGRQIDRLIVAAFNGTAKTGADQGTSTTFSSSQKVAVGFGASGNTNLTVAKLREARRILMANNLDMEAEDFFCVVNAKAHDSLLKEAQVVSSDFNAGAPVLKDGRVSYFMGMNIVHTELVANDASTSDYIMVYAKSGMHLGIWNDISTHVSERNDLQSIPWQAYVKMTAGATRLEEKKCVQIACYNA